MRRAWSLGAGPGAIDDLGARHAHVGIGRAPEFEHSHPSAPPRSLVATSGLSIAALAPTTVPIDHPPYTQAGGGEA